MKYFFLFCLLHWNRTQYIPNSIKATIAYLRVSKYTVTGQKKGSFFFCFFFTIYGHDGYFGHVTRSFHVHIGFLFL